MIPLKDDIPARSVPAVTLALIAANVLVFSYQLSLAGGGDPAGARAASELVAEFGAVPCRLSGTCGGPNVFPPPVVTALTAMFLHGGLFHVGGNMLYLWIFGPAVEDELGHARFLLLYLLAGLAGSVAQTVVDPDSPVPVVGASGAVSGVLGGYLLRFPYARILTLVTVGFFVRFVRVPAVLVLGFWVVVQLLNGVLTVAAPTGRPVGGVAWFAHIGGFLGGVGLVFVLRARRGRRL
jgi:membrane associated rhomboid family serine protease